MLGVEGNNADRFFALLEGRVAIEANYPGLETVVLQSLHANDIVGWSWLFAPYEWVFDARAKTRVRALVFDAECLRKKMEGDPDLGFQLIKRFSHVMITRLKATRLQLLDAYGRMRLVDKDINNAI